MAFETIGVRAVIEGLAAFERASRVIKKELVDIIDKEQELERQNEQVRKGLRNIGLAMVAAATASGAFLFSATRLAARVETLGVVTTQLGKNVGLTEKEVRALEKSIKAQGITLRKTRSAIALMIQANIDLTKGTELARLAQDAAVIANVNSSEAFERLVVSITAADVGIARTLGLQVSFQGAYKKSAEALGKVVTELTEQEKIQARTNVILDAGAQIAGTYAAAMETAGKKVLSLDRHLEESRRILGEVFLPVFADVVDKVTEGLKAFEGLDTATQRQISTGLAMGTVWTGLIGGAALFVSSLDKIKTAIKTLGLAMKTSLGPVGLFLVLLAAITTAIVAQNAKLRELRRQFDLLEKEAKQASTTYEGYVKETLALAEETGQLVKTQEEMNDLLPAIRDRLLETGRVTVLLSEETFNATTAYEKYVDAVMEAAEETGQLVVTQEELEKFTDRARSRLFAFNEVVVLATKGMFNLDKIAEGYNKDIREQAEALEDAKDSTEDLTEAQETLEEQQERLQGRLSDLKDLMREDITKGFIEWKVKTEDLTARLEELESQTEELTEAQVEEMGEIRSQLEKTNEAWRDHTAKVIFNLAVQVLAIEGLTEKEIVALAALQERLGLVDEGFAELTEAVIEAGGVLNTEGGKVQDFTDTLLGLQDAATDATTDADDLAESLRNLPSRIDIEVVITQTGTVGPIGGGGVQVGAGGGGGGGGTPIPTAPSPIPSGGPGGGGGQEFGFAIAASSQAARFANSINTLVTAIKAAPLLAMPTPAFAPAIAAASQSNTFNMNIQTSAPREPIIQDFRTLEALSNAL